jgi:hypothetical protein
MSSGLQFPNEHVWLDNVIKAFLEVIKGQWQDGIDESIARARSNWLLAQFDIRHWSHRFKIEGRPGISEERYRGQVLALSMLDTGVTKATKEKYWNWFDEALLEPIKASQPDAYRDIVEQVQALITEAAERDSDGGPDGD